LEKGEENGVVVDAVGDVKEAGRGGTVGGVEEEVDPALAEIEVEVGRAGADEEGPGAGAGDVDAADAAVPAAAAIVPLRSHGFGGEAIVRVRG